MSKRKIGPNVKKVATLFMSKDAVPDGGGLLDGVKFLSNPKKIAESYKASVQKVWKNIDEIKAIPSNPYGDDDEAIAGAMLDKLKEVKENK